MTNYQAIMTDANNLYRAYLRSIATSKWKESTQRVEDNYLRIISRLQKQLTDRTYKSGIETEFTLHERGKIRPITSLQVPDRMVRHVLCDDILTPRIRPYIIYDNGASTKGRGLSFTQGRFDTHIQKHYREHNSNKGWILFGDFTKFYDNIPHDNAKRELLFLCENDEYMEWLLNTVFKNFLVDISAFTRNDLIYFKDHPFDKHWYRNNRYSNKGRRFMEKSVNIGDQLAQDIGIYYPYRIDNYVKIVRGQKYYARYMDDFYIISDNRYELETILDGIKFIASDLGLYLNEKKTRIVRLDKPFRFLQTRYLVTDTGKIIKRINPKTVTSLRRKLKSLARKYENGAVDYEDIESMFRSEMGNYYKLMSKNTRHDLIDLYENLFNCKISIHKGKMRFDRRL